MQAFPLKRICKVCFQEMRLVCSVQRLITREANVYSVVSFSTPGTFPYLAGCCCVGISTPYIIFVLLFLRPFSRLPDMRLHRACPSPLPGTAHDSQQLQMPHHCLACLPASLPATAYVFVCIAGGVGILSSLVGSRRVLDTTRNTAVLELC